MLRHGSPLQLGWGARYNRRCARSPVFNGKKRKKKPNPYGFSSFCPFFSPFLFFPGFSFFVCPPLAQPAQNRQTQKRLENEGETKKLKPPWFSFFRLCILSPCFFYFMFFPLAPLTGEISLSTPGGYFREILTTRESRGGTRRKQKKEKQGK